MATVSTSPSTRANVYLGPIVLGGIVVFLGQALHMFIVPILIFKNPAIVAWQYIASGALGMSAFEGGAGAAWLGVFFHLLFSMIIAAVFVVAAGRLPFLRRNLIAGSLLYGAGVYFVMNFIVTPLSAAPPLPMPALPWIIEGLIEHALMVGLLLGIIVKRSAGAK